MKVYLVQYQADDESTALVIGIYSIQESAQAAIQRLRTRAGFSENPQRFFVDEYALDEDNWTEGFTTYSYTSGA